jgi:hypothetical protein
MSFNLRVSVLNWNSFWSNHVDSLIIKVNKCQIIDHCIISNIFMSLVWSYLVWVRVNVVGFGVKCSSCFFFCLIHFGQEKLCFCVLFFASLICFWHRFCFGNLWFNLWLNQIFQVNLVKLKSSQRVKTLFHLQFFC